MCILKGFKEKLLIKWHLYIWKTVMNASERHYLLVLNIPGVHMDLNTS